MEALIAGVVVIVVSLLAGFGVGRVKGRQLGDKVAEAERRNREVAEIRAAGERMKAEAAQMRKEVDREVESLPAESDGKRLSSRDRLRLDWTRD